MTIDISAIRAQFPSLSRTDNGQRRIYLDNPAGTQVPDAVVRRIGECLVEGNANLGGHFRTAELAGQFVQQGRAAMADFLNAPSADEVMFGQNMTSLTMHLSRSIGNLLQPGDEVILTRMEHDANISPWLQMAEDHDLEIRWMPFNTESFEFDADALEDVLSDRSRLLCIGGASNLTGTLNDIRLFCRKARDAGVMSFVDGVQSAPHVLPDVQDTSCDFFACSAYKFFGPHQGILWGRRELLERLEPYKVRPSPAELPWRFETGTQSHEGIAGTGAAVNYFAALGDGGGKEQTRRAHLVQAFARLFEHEKALSVRLVAGLGDIRGITVQGISDSAAMHRRVPTVSFTHDKVAPDVLARGLSKRNIFVWSGHNYGLEPARVLGLLESGGVLRVGAVHYNTLEEIDETLAAIEEIVS